MKDGSPLIRGNGFTAPPVKLASKTNNVALAARAPVLSVAADLFAVLV